MIYTYYIKDKEINRSLIKIHCEFILILISFPEGHIFGGGAICMELLNPNGWSSVYTVEAIITQLTATIVEGKGRIAFGAHGK